MNCQQRRDLLLLYVTDALEAAETREIRQHLQTGCPECAGYLAEAQAVMGFIPLGLTPIAPPARLKQKLMARIDADLESKHSKTVSSMRLAPSKKRSESLAYRLMRYLIPTAAAAAIAVLATHSVMMQRVNDLEHETTVLRSQTTDTAVDLSRLQSQFQSQTQVVEMLRSPELKVIHLQPTNLQPGAVANLLWDQRRQQWAILTTGMKPAAPGQTYELWFVTKAGAAVAAGTFDVDVKGMGSLLVDIPKRIGGLKLAAVTNEKTGGVAVPAGQFQVTGSVE